MYRQETCVTATCDHCRGDYDTDHDDYPGIVHFTTQADAERSLTAAGWRVQAGGRLTCRACATDQDCATYGHTWEPWRTCLCDQWFAGPRPEHRTTPDGTCTHQRRWCDRCLAGQDRPATEQESDE